MKHEVTCIAAGPQCSILTSSLHPGLPSYLGIESAFFHWRSGSNRQRFDHVTPLPDPLKLSPIACAAEAGASGQGQEYSHFSLLVLHPHAPACSAPCTFLSSESCHFTNTQLMSPSLRSLLLLLGGHDWFFSSLQVPSPLTSPRSGL